MNTNSQRTYLVHFSESLNQRGGPCFVLEICASCQRAIRVQSAKSSARGWLGACPGCAGRAAEEGSALGGCCLLPGALGRARAECTRELVVGPEGRNPPFCPPSLVLPGRVRGSWCPSVRFPDVPPLQQICSSIPSALCNCNR